MFVSRIFQLADKLLPEESDRYWRASVNDNVGCPIEIDGGEKNEKAVLVTDDTWKMQK